MCPAGVAFLPPQAPSFSLTFSSPADFVSIHLCNQQEDDGTGASRLKKKSDLFWPWSSCESLEQQENKLLTMDTSAGPDRVWGQRAVVWTRPLSAVTSSAQLVVSCEGAASSGH